MTLRPILKLLALPVTILTLGLFALIINALMLILTSKIVPGFHVDSFFAAFFGSIVLSIVNSIMSAALKE